MSQPRILLVEDHEDTSEVMAEFLQSSGYEVKVADTVAAALAIVEQEPFDLVLSDLGLPDGTGYELMRALRDKHDLRGVALSGYGRDQDVDASRAAGFVEHVTKPPNPAKLLQVLARVLGS
jgi:CheY-like chemotaxis protein